MGGKPDFMLTLWDWKQEKIVLRSKAFSQDVFRVTFSTELDGQLTSSGTGHIRFWKMARTFTGLKLQGQLGKFGRTEISDIEGYVELPDGKVLSGCEWGNLLLWDGGLIKVEISRKGKMCASRLAAIDASNRPGGSTCRVARRYFVEKTRIGQVNHIHQESQCR